MLAPETLLRYAGAYSPPWGMYSGKSFKPNGDIPYYGFLFWFRPDGLRLFTLRNPHFVGVYNIATAWDVSTASYFTQNAALRGFSPSGFQFSPDGVYAFSADGYDNMLGRSKLSTPWDISTMEADRLVPAGFNVGDIFISPDGKRLFIFESNPDALRQYTLSTPWDISTMVYVRSVNLSISARSIFFDPAGKLFYTRDYHKNRVIQYTLSTPWDISTMVQKTRSIKLLSPGTDIYIDPSGTRMYTMTANSSPIAHVIHQYDIPSWPR